MNAASPTARLRQWSRSIRRDVHALYLCMRDPRTPWPAKALAAVVVGYALSPIDLIPDFVPLLGYLDDVVLIPLGLLAVRAMIPPQVLAENRVIADRSAERPTSAVAAVVIVAIWGISLVLAGWAAHAWWTAS